MQNKQFIVHIQLANTEMEVPVFAESIDRACEWAEEQYETQGYVINRIRSKE